MINKTASKIYKLHVIEALFFLIVLVEVNFVELIFVEIVFVSPIISSHITSKSPISSAYLRFLHIPFAGFQK